MATLPDSVFRIPPEPPDVPSRLLSTCLGLARCLLAEHPTHGERLTADLPEVREIMERGEGVVRWYDPEDPGYISARNGVRTSSETLPDWADPSDVIEMAVPTDPGRRMLERLQATAARVAEVAPEYYAKLRIGQTVGAVESRYEDALVQDTITLAPAAVEHPALDARASSTPFDLDPFRSIADLARQEYHYLRISGDGAREILSILAMLEVAGPYAGSAFEYARQQTRGLLQELPGDRKVLLPLLDLDFWLDSFDMTSGGRAWIPALSGARVCHVAADDYRDRARKRLSFEEFHRLLYLALAYYRAARRLYGAVLKISPLSIHKERLEEARSSHRVCEEMRARIEVSLAWAVDANPMGYNLTYSHRMDAWVAHLAAESRDKAVCEILDIASQLACPDFVKDLALARADLSTPGTIDQCIERAAIVAHRLEDNLAMLGGFGIGYFEYANALTAHALEMAGRPGDAQPFREHLSMAWLKQRLAQ